MGLVLLGSKTELVKMLLTILTMAVALLLPPASPLPRHLGRSGRQGRGGRGGHGGGHRLAPPPPPSRHGSGRRGRQEQIETGTQAPAPSELEISPPVYEEVDDPRAAGASAPEFGYGAPAEEEYVDADASLGIYGAPGKGGKGNRGQGNGGDNGGRGEGGDLPAWCNPKDPMGAWMNYIKIRQWCESNGFTEHGPYGGNTLD